MFAYTLTKRSTVNVVCARMYLNTYVNYNRSNHNFRWRGVHDTPITLHGAVRATLIKYLTTHTLEWTAIPHHHHRGRGLHTARTILRVPVRVVNLHTLIHAQESKTNMPAPMRNCYAPAIGPPHTLTWSPRPLFEYRQRARAQHTQHTQMAVETTPKQHGPAQSVRNPATHNLRM